MSLVQTHALSRGPRRFSVGESSSAPAGDYYLSTISRYLIDYDVNNMGLANNASLTTLPDKGWTGMNLGGGTAPTNVISSTEIGGMAYASFNGSTQYLFSSSSFVMNQPMTYFVVAKYIEASNLNRFMFDGYTAVDQRQTLFRTGGGATVTAGSNINTFAPSFTWVNVSGLWRLWEVHLNGAASSVILNGTSLGTGDAGSGAGSGIRGFVFGCRCDGAPNTYGWSGGIARIVGFNKDVTGTELINIRNYFRSKYLLY